MVGDICKYILVCLLKSVIWMCYISITSIIMLSQMNSGLQWSADKWASVTE